MVRIDPDKIPPINIFPTKEQKEEPTPATSPAKKKSKRGKKRQSRDLKAYFAGNLPEQQQEALEEEMKQLMQPIIESDAAQQYRFLPIFAALQLDLLNTKEGFIPALLEFCGMEKGNGKTWRNERDKFNDYCREHPGETVSSFYKGMNVNGIDLYERYKEALRALRAIMDKTDWEND